MAARPPAAGAHWVTGAASGIGRATARRFASEGAAVIVNYIGDPGLEGGMKLLTQSIARELAPDRIRVVSVAPGAVRTPINAEVVDDPDTHHQVVEQAPWGRIGMPEEIAGANTWLAGPDADYVTGSTLFVDGGMTLYPRFT